MSDPHDGSAGPAPGPADYALRLRAAPTSAGGRAPEPPEDAFYERRAACFVTLKKHGELRGCIGTLEPAEPSLGGEIARNAHSSALRDPRFPPVTGDELEALTCSVDVLSPSEPCALTDLDPQVYGVIVEAGVQARRPAARPRRASTPSTHRSSIALQKAGIAADEPFDVRRFTVTRYRQGDAPAEPTTTGGCAPGDD